MSEIESEPMYRNLKTGNCDRYDGWWFEEEDGVQKNAVDEKMVVEVFLNEYGDWVERLP